MASRHHPRCAHARHSFTAIWTGTEMIAVHGGCNGGSEFCTDGSGGCHNPATDTRGTHRLNGTGLTAACGGLVGQRQLVAAAKIPTATVNCSILVTQGARYNPATDAWTPMILDNAPAGMRNPRAVWATIR
ncbi:MAG: hypothetical protein IPL78_34730 [Chloroflexi bacterium]|nr:hypothetical protein [Chloroflexota bacterium]